MVASVKQAVVVLGMHRSGTSALARALSFFGYALPRDVLPPQPDNPKGYWEPRGIMRLNEAILEACGASWDRPGPWFTRQGGPAETRAVLRKEVRRHWRDEAAAALQTSFGDAPAIVLKDPRIALFVPLWKEVLTEAGFAPRFVLIHRNPLDVAASLKARNDIASRHAFQLWQRYVLSALSPDNGVRPDAIVSYENLIARPDETMAGVLAQLERPAGDAQAFAQLREFISAADCHHLSTDEALEASPLVAGQVKKVRQMLNEWDATPPPKRSARVRAFCDAFDDAVLLFGPFKLFQPDGKSARPVEGAALEGVDEKLLILHYHLFKNAGSSIDVMLRRNFAARWQAQEFDPAGPRSNVEAVTAYLKAQPQLLALSSHTALMPLPALEDRHILPVVFLRHPVDRLKSAYAFERKQGADTEGARLAKALDFAGYLRTLLASPGHGQARNFQAHRLAFNAPASSGSQRERALHALDALPFVGLVEAYEASVAKLESLIRPFAPGFRSVILRKNVGPKRADTLEERLAEIEAEIGTALYAELCAANDDDLALFASVRARYTDVVNS
jgi:hypothetical protein